jgi:hypothetical protein
MNLRASAVEIGRFPALEILTPIRTGSKMEILRNQTSVPKPTIKLDMVFSIIMNVTDLGQTVLDNNLDRSMKMLEQY